MKVALINLSKGDCRVFKDLKGVMEYANIKYDKLRSVASTGVPYILDDGNILVFSIDIHTSSRGGYRDNAFKR